MFNRSLSSLIALCYICAAFFVDEGGGLVVRLLIALVFPLSCIWFGDALGGFIGFMKGRYVNSETPGGFVCFGGWLLLVGVPLLVFIFSL